MKLSEKYLSIKGDLESRWGKKRNNTKKTFKEKKIRNKNIKRRAVINYKPYTLLVVY